MASNPPEKRRRISRKNKIPAKVNLCPTTLNDDVIDHIISFLPIKEASRTSILSKRFENSWKYSKHLKFDSILSRKYDLKDLVKMIHRVISLHSAPKIETFHLCVNSFNMEPFIYIWFKTALSKNPEFVDIDLSMGRGFVPPLKIPFHLFDIESIQSLRFNYCSLYLPTTLTGLRFLRALILKYMKLRCDVIKIVVDNCSLLECIDVAECHDLRRIKLEANELKYFKVLKIGDCYQLDYIYVDAPTLEVFHFYGKPYNIIFQGGMQKVRDVMLNFIPISYALPRIRMKNLMLSIWNVKVLTVNSTLLEDLCSTFINGTTPKGPNDYLWSLKELQILMETSSFCNPYDIVKFVDKCPVLERLFIDFQKFAFDATSHYWNMHDSAKFDAYEKQQSFLKMVKITNFKFNMMELKLIKFFLAKSPSLENLAIFTVKKYRIRDSPNSALFLDHLRSWRSSLRTKIGVYEYNDREDAVLAPKHKGPIWY